MIEILGLIIMIIGGIIMILSTKWEEENIGCIILLIGGALLIIGLLIMGITVITTSQCEKECKAQNLIFNHQEVNCEGELTCYCKEKVTPKVMIIK